MKIAFSESGIAPLYPDQSNPKIILAENTKVSLIPRSRKILICLLLGVFAYIAYKYF